MNCEGNSTFEFLPEFFCQMIELKTNTECSGSEQNSSICISCTYLGKFLTGESMQEIYSLGHILSLIMWTLIVVIGLLGVFNNFLIIFVLRRMKSSRPFDVLIMFLACFDMLCCASTVISCTISVGMIFQLWLDKGAVTMYSYLISIIVTLFGRTASTFMAVLITIERFLVIVFPFHAKIWFTSWKTSLLAVGVIIVSILINTPRFLIYDVKQNDYKRASVNITSLRGFEYYIGFCSPFACLFEVRLDAFHDLLDFLAPLPILLIFNALSYMKVRKIQNKRRKLNRALKSEIEALKLFLPVVIAHFATNIVPFVHYFTYYVFKILYREMFMAVGLSVVINSVVNFYIYSYQRQEFKKESKAVISNCLRRASFNQLRFRWRQQSNIETGTGSST